MDINNIIPTIHLSNVRASARIRAKKEIRPSNSIVPPVRKKQKIKSLAEPELVLPKPPARVRGRRGLLKNITEMPLDVLFEIFGHLEPQDVLHVSQANKALHSILKAPSANAIWVSALSIAKPRPPPCPADLTTAQYVHLLYSTHCSLCGSRQISIFHYEMRVKACKNCLQTKYYDYRTQQHGENIRGLCMTRMMRRTDSRVYDTICLKRDHDKLQSELAKLGNDEKAVQKFIQDRRGEIPRRKLHAEECTRWRGIQQEERAQVVADTRERRKDAIHAKIRSIGWGEELQVLDHRDVRHIPGLNIAKDLTEKAWSTLEPVVIEYLKSHKEQRLAKERQRVLTIRFSEFRGFLQNSGTQRDTALLPSVIDLAMMEPFRSLIFDTPLDRKVEKKDFFRKQRLLQELTPLFNENRNELLVSLLPKPKNARRKSKRVAGDVTRLQLATTFFHCKWCRDTITYSRVLVHNCLTIPHPEEQNDENVDSHNWRDIIHPYLNIAPWNYGDNQVSFEDEVSELAAAFIGICGEDPQTVTMEHMDSLDVRLECVSCCHPSRGRLVMKWKLAIIHEMEHHFSEDDIDDIRERWNKVSQDDVVKVHAKEERSKVKSVSKCSICHTTIPGKKQAEHIRSHKIYEDNLDFNSRFYTPLDIPFKQPPYAVRIH